MLCNCHFRQPLKCVHFSDDADVPQDPLEQLCGGVLNADAELGGKFGPKLTKALGKVGQILLGKSVINEQYLIETEDINIYTKMVPGRLFGHYSHNFTPFAFLGKKIVTDLTWKIDDWTLLSLRLSGIHINRIF